MADLEALFRVVDELTPDERRQLMAYVERTSANPTEQSISNDIKRARVFDLHAGKIRTTDDFDDELPDSFWLQSNP